MSSESPAGIWLPRIGWLLVILAFVTFVWGLQRRARFESEGEEPIRMLFVPSVEQGTLVQRGDELARFIREDSGLMIRTEVPTSYAAVIQALGSGQADVAWMPAFAYVIANARYGAEARLQIVRSADRFGILVAREGFEEPESPTDLGARRIAIPTTLPDELRAMLVETLDREAPGWTEIPAESDKDAVRRLVDSPGDIAAAASSMVPTGPHDLVGDGRRELEYDRPGTLRQTRVIHTTEEPVAQDTSVYHGCVYTRTDSGVRRLEDLNGRTYAFSDETSTSGHIFPRLLLERSGVELGRVYYAGGHPNVVQAVWDGKALGGSAFHSPANKQQREEGLVVGDARYLILKRMAEPERRAAFLEEIRVLALTDPIPNDLCAVRRGFPAKKWQRFVASLDRFLETEQGKAALFDLLAGVAVTRTDDAAFGDFRAALTTAGIRAEGLLEAAEERLEKRRQKESGS